MPFTIEFSLELEKERIRFTNSKLNWYKEHKYNISLPKDLEKEFNSENYLKAKEQIQESLKELSAFLNKLKETTNKPVEKEYIIILTKYGTGGSYNPQNKIIVNISNKERIIETIKHEIVHLALEQEVKEKGLSHEEKENLIHKT